MSRTTSEHSLKRAFGFSTALHLLGAALFPLFLVRALVPEPSAERVIVQRKPPSQRSLLTLRRISRQEHPPIEAPHLVTARLVAEPASPVPAFTARRTLVAAVHRIAHPLPTARGQAPAIPLRNNVSAPVAPPAVASARAAASPPAVPATEASPPVAPVGGWGEFARPLVADSEALARIRTRYAKSGLIRITIDEGGHATEIDFTQSALDEGLRTALEQQLKTLRYLPAECNGLHCAGALDIIL